MTKKAWKGSRYRATCCDSEIQSQYSGHFVRCTCGKVAVDETPYYGRIIGNSDNLELLLDNVQDVMVHLDEEEKL